MLDGSVNETYGGSWTDFFDLTCFDDIRGVVLAEVLGSRGYGKVIHQLASYKDKKKRAALEIADSDSREIMAKYLYFCGRYEVQSGPACHRSATAVVVNAEDHGVVQQYKKEIYSAYDIKYKIGL